MDTVGAHTIIGGFIMGLGMVLAAGCPFRIITRVSEGDMNALGAVFGMLAGITVFAHLLPFLVNFFSKYRFSEHMYLFQLLKSLF